ncbi:MAG: hypothetical protein PHQ52_01650 [Candidatus Omnitrophica bacterium]|nr:hypothetical protein [Candidatus Omnitrophota bacterium]
MILVVDPNISLVKISMVNTKNNCEEIFSEVLNMDQFDGKVNFRAVMKRICKNKKVKAISFRAVFGGDVFKTTTKVTPYFMEKLRKLTGSFPLYIPTLGKVIKNFYDFFRGINMFVFFETTFFSKLPDEEKCYAIPVELSKNNSFKRYGFHGIFHEDNAELVSLKSKLVSIVFDSKTTVCSALGQKPYSISLGYTPLEGIMSASSCGDLDSGIVFYLMKRYGNSLFKIDDILKRQSGFYGLTGYDIKIQELIKLYGKDDKVTLAFDVYRNQILKYLGEAISVLGGIDHLVISGSETKTFFPIICKLLKDISFLGINPKCLPWEEDGVFVELTTHESDIKVSINYQTLAEIIAHKTIKTIKSK